MQKAGKRALKSEAQCARALELRMAGHSYRAIGKLLGLSHVRAYQIVIEALDELRSNNKESAEQLKKLELERLDAMTVKLFARRHSARVADTLLRIMERRAKILGLDSPAKFEGSGPGGTPLVPPALIVNFPHANKRDKS